MITMVSRCPHCTGVTPLVANAWVCVPCRRIWPIGTVMHPETIPLPQPRYDVIAWNQIVKELGG